MHADVDATTAWTRRGDPFSSYRAGFEVRTTRLCRRVLDVPPFRGRSGRRAALPGAVDRLLLRPGAGAVGPGEPRRTRSCEAVTQSGIGAVRRRLPHEQPAAGRLRIHPARSSQDPVEIVDPAAGNLPSGLDGSRYRWIDLHGEGITGILTEQADAWFYKRNLSPASTHGHRRRSPRSRQSARDRTSRSPAGANSWTWPATGTRMSCVRRSPSPGCIEHDDAEGWQPFRALRRPA